MAKKQTNEEPLAAPALDLGDDSLDEVKQETPPPASDNDVGQARGEDPPATAVARQGDDARPYCGKHNCLMRATSSKARTTHYGCPVPGCGATEKRARKTQHVPAEPKACPDVRCEKKKSFLEVDPAKSSPAFLHMNCPECGFALKEPRPQFRDILRRQQQEFTEDLSAR